MTTGVCMIFFQGRGFSLADAARVLATTQLSLTLNQDYLTVRWNAGPELKICLVDGPWVQQEAAEIGAMSPYATTMCDCDRRFEISCTDLDAVLDETNTLIEAQATLQVATHGILFNTWNGTLLGPSAA